MNRKNRSKWTTVRPVTVAAARIWALNRVQLARTKTIMVSRSKRFNSSAPMGRNFQRTLCSFASAGNYFKQQNRKRLIIIMMGWWWVLRKMVIVPKKHFLILWSIWEAEIEWVSTSVSFFSFEILFHIIMIIIVLSHNSCRNLSLLFSAVVVNANRTIILTLQDEKWAMIITQSKSWLRSHVPKRPRSATDKYSDLTETCWLAVINSRNTD